MAKKKRKDYEINHLDKKPKNNKFKNLRIMTKKAHKKQFGKKGRR